MIQEYSIQDKYQVFTLDLSNGLKDKEIDTMVPETNFLTTFFVDTNTGESITLGKINISFTSSKNYPLTFLNGSKYKAQFQKMYLNAPAQARVSVRIFVSVNAFYEKEQPVTNAIFEQPMNIYNNPQNYSLVSLGGNVTGLLNISIPATLDSKTVKGIKSILISNTDNKDLYFGYGLTAGNYQDIGTLISPQEKLSIDFNPLSVAPFGFSLYSATTCKYQYNVLFTY